MPPFTDREKLENIPYEHIDYVTTIEQANCFLCGDGADPLTATDWGEDNVGILDLNTFEILRLEINRYDDQGNLIEKAAGYMSSCSMSDKESDSYAHAYCFPDNAYADVQLSGVQYAIDRDSVQNHLCRACLDSINDLRYTDQAPAKYAIISFEDRSIQPLLNTHPWFSTGNYGIDCDFQDNGKIDLLIHYIANRFEENE